MAGERAHRGHALATRATSGAVAWFPPASQEAVAGRVCGATERELRPARGPSPPALLKLRFTMCPPPQVRKSVQPLDDRDRVVAVPLEGFASRRSGRRRRARGKPPAPPVVAAEYGCSASHSCGFDRHRLREGPVGLRDVGSRVERSSARRLLPGLGRCLQRRRAVRAGHEAVFLEHRLLPALRVDPAQSPLLSRGEDVTLSAFFALARPAPASVFRTPLASGLRPPFFAVLTRSSFRLWCRSAAIRSRPRSSQASGTGSDPTGLASQGRALGKNPGGGPGGGPCALSRHFCT